MPYQPHKFYVLSPHPKEPMPRHVAVTALVVSATALSLTSCSQSSDDPSTNAVETTTPAVPIVEVDTKNTSGYAMLNGFEILPANSPAICTRQQERMTVILGNIGSKTVASAIIDAGKVTDVTISDPEDTLTLTAGAGTATLTQQGPVFTLEGQAPGVRKANTQSGEMPMTFLMTFECP
ncbi:lipoprotein LpqH [Corynebacterium epidermidicanis]|uniref:Lipoprotein antigen n=1 Tax=Corynebacterium epidermidicanis TaxID=1050174 RepID=A0A0G3GY89_9CORY|nr:lipoprotein LpqH [Corynebacterium epidermidicanis]AKK03807.1 hypothetical protein CEPID_09820 [Corynebacterium epidermidicanis]